MWAIVAGLLLGSGIAWWLARDAPEKREARQKRAESAAAASARDARPSLHRWRDANGVLQITDKPPPNGRYERIDRDADRAISVKGDRGD